MIHPSTPDTTEAELEKLIGKRCTTKDTDDFPELRDDDPARCFVCKTWEAIDRHRQAAVEDLEIQHTKELEECIEFTRNELLDELERELPKDKVFPGGLDNGLSGQMHGFNVAVAQVKQLLAEKRKAKQ